MTVGPVHVQMSTRLAAGLLGSVVIHTAVLAAAGFGSVGREARATTVAGAAPAEIRAHLLEIADSLPPSIQPTPLRRPESSAPAKPGVPAPHYFLSRELDGRPAPLAQIWPEYPERAARRHLSGTVTVRVYIDELGVVAGVETVQASPPGYFEESAMQAFRSARFTPGIRKGKAVKCQMVYQVSFEEPSAARR